MKSNVSALMRKVIVSIKDTTMIAAALPYLNQYRKKVGINTCVSKAPFLGTDSSRDEVLSVTRAI